MTAISSLFLLRQFGAVALAVHCDQFAALFDHALQQRRISASAMPAVLPVLARGDVAVFQPGDDQPHGRDRARSPWRASPL